jgi:uncharacterized SAM-binding protein YcdF (DUF218 family)
LNVVYRRLQAASAWALWILLLLIVVPIAPQVALHLSDRWDEPRGDVLVVLGGEMLGDGTIGVGSYWRSVYAARVWRAGKFRWLIVCGGKPPDHPRSLAAAMASLLVSQGVPREAILLDEQSGSTRENALRAKALIPHGAGQVALVTSDYHMWRARRVFERIGVPAVAIPFPDVGKRWSYWPSRLECYATLSAELIKIA